MELPMRMLAAFLVLCLTLMDPAAQAAQPRQPNILLVVMDDVGIDQMGSFGYGGDEPPIMPNMDMVAAAGVRFRNNWAQPECSNGRMAIFTGRWPLRSHVYQAIGGRDLSQSQIKPYDITPPRMLRTKGYVSGYFGKYHLGGPEHNPAEFGAPASVGFDYFYGWIGGLPGSIDTTAGGIAERGTYNCGLVPDAETVDGANSGACYIPQSNGGVRCRAISGVDPWHDPAGQQCLAMGGVFKPGEACARKTPEDIVFERENAHYVSPLVINRAGKVERVPLSDPRGRGYRASIEVSAAVSWIKAAQRLNKPWMATVSFSSDHSPFQPPPGRLLHSGRYPTQDCVSTANIRALSEAQIEAMDSEFGRLLEQTGLARRERGTLVYDPSASNTVIIIVGDNGSYGPTVQVPFDVNRNKASPYQTGVWVPLIVAGNVVRNPDREVNAMTSSTDIFQLIGELAGVDVHSFVPRVVDSLPLLPYLTNPAQTPIRQYNFAQGNFNTQANGSHNQPCVIGGSTCTQVPISKGVCEDNGGVWWGEGADDPSVLEVVDECWQVNKAIYDNDPEHYDDSKAAVTAPNYIGFRNDQYKLVRNVYTDYNTTTHAPEEIREFEFYKIATARDDTELDTADANLVPGGLSPEEQENFDDLQLHLINLLASDVECPGDGNGDGVVNAADAAGVLKVASAWGHSSTYDFNTDGLTNADDLAIVNAHLGVCPLN